eukprot:2148268-Alexandrium_andersonii.AAC.1
MAAGAGCSPTQPWDGEDVLNLPPTPQDSVIDLCTQQGAAHASEKGQLQSQPPCPLARTLTEGERNELLCA